jgi:photosystem II stability/assembly factor-like uncharacterized protein
MPGETLKPQSRSTRARGRIVSGAGTRRRGVLILGFLLALLAAVTAGVVWQVSSEGGGTTGVLETGDFHALAFSPTDANTIFFGHHNGIMRSTDGGRTWSALVDRPNFDAMGLAVSRANPRQMYLAGHNLFQMSTDAGASWQPIEHNLPGTDIHGFAMSPGDANHLLALVAGQGGFQSMDAGRTWQPLGGQMPGDVMALAMDGGTPTTIYAASMSAGVVRSSDGGQSWAPARQTTTVGGVYTLAVSPGAAQTVYAGGDGGLFQSTDGGITWSKLPFPGDNVVALAASPAQPKLVLAITVKGQQGLVYRSEDGGQSWSRP